MNVGCTCFMNSILQCLFHIHRRTRFLSPSRKADESLAGALRSLASAIGSSDGPITPRKFKRVMDRTMPFFSDRNAHDAFEFLVQLLDLVHNDIGDVTPLFYGNNVAMRRFRCGKEEQAVDQPAFWMLPLPRRKKPLNLSDCIDEWRKIEPEDEANPLFCPGHRRAEPYTMEMRVERFARYVVIQLSRFDKTGGGSKDNRRVKYPFDFPSNDFADQDTGKYSLVAVVCHRGHEYGGHYTCIVGDPTEAIWYEISDDDVRRVQREDAVRDEAYILFYEQQRPQQSSQPRGK
jgi:ubiquitin C-terminal hydrolase